MKIKFILTALFFAALSFFLTPVLWPDPAGSMAPAVWQLPFFIVFGIFETLAFGIGMSFLIWGWPRLRAAGQSLGMTWAAFLSITWLLISWWPHDNLHRIMPHGDFNWLLSLEYGFHVTLIIAGFILARFFWQMTRQPAL